MDAVVVEAEVVGVEEGSRLTGQRKDWKSWFFMGKHHGAKAFWSTTKASE